MTAPHLGPGHSIAGKYTVRALLGFTGEVATYLAVSNDGREVVVKLYDPGVGQRADVMAQLDRVRQQMVQLPPGMIVVPFDAGYDTGTGAPFSTSEYLQVPSLAKLVETGPLSPDVVALIMRGLSTILDHAHAIGLYHLALKPTNVFVGPAPQYPIRVTDFDASVIRRTSPATHDVYSQSAPWWAPEQLQPAAVLGPAADVFAGALIAFYALAGRPYWLSCQSHPPDLPNWQLELMGQRIPVSQRARELGAVINPLFDGVFGRSLSINQPDRPQSSMELANVLASASGADLAPRTMAFPEMSFDASAASAPYVDSDQGGYVATGGGSAGSVHSLDSHASPGLPPFPPPVQRKQTSSMLPIIIGITAAVLIGGGGMMLLLMRTSPETKQTAAASASAAATESPAPKPANTATSESNNPTPAPSPQPEPSAAPEDAAVSITIRCKPECDRMEIDGQPVENPEKLELKPGKYKLTLVKQGHLIHKETLEVGDKPIEKEIALVKIPASKPPPSKGCGQFLCP